MLERILNKDLIEIQKYFCKWYLTVNPQNSVMMSFHLNNYETNRQLDIEIDGKKINNMEALKYLGVKLDRI